MIGGDTIDVDGWDFFVSCAADARGWAEWVSWQLEEAGFSVLVQAWDFTPGANWVAMMQEGVRRARRTMAVVSAGYTESVFGAVEWQAAFAEDPTGQARKLLPVRVEDCDRPGLLGHLVSIDLFDVAEPVAHERLLAAARLAVSGGRAKPGQAPPLPPSLRAVSGPALFPGRVWMLPPQAGPVAVVAREDLEQELLEALLAGGAGLVGVTTALEGAGGFGKTTPGKCPSRIGVMCVISGRCLAVPPGAWPWAPCRVRRGDARVGLRHPPRHARRDVADGALVVSGRGPLPHAPD